MADDPKTKPTSDASSDTSDRTEKTPQPQIPAPASYGAAVWKERARATFKASPHAVAGALAYADGDSWTEDEVREALDQFSVREGT